MRCGFVAVLAAALLALPSGALAATIDVNTSTDAIAADGKCSLREAITSANVHAAPFAGPGECAPGTGGDTIVLPPAPLLLGIAGRGEDNNATGDLDIRAGGLTIRGAGAAVTTLDAQHVDRAIDVLPGATVTIEGVTITHGTTQDGTNGTDRMGPPVNVSGGNGGPGEPGGGIRNAGTLTLQDVVITGNAAGAGGRGGNAHGEDGAFGTIGPGYGGGFGHGGDGGYGGAGGGVFDTGLLTLVRVTVTGNVAGAGGHGGAGTGGNGGGSTAAAGGDAGRGDGGSGGNGGAGGGIAETIRGTLTVKDSSVSANSAGAGGEGGLGEGGAGGPSAASPGAGGSGGPATGGAGGEGGGGGGAAADTLVITSSLLQGNAAGRGGDGGSATGGPGGGVAGTSGTGGGAGRGMAGRGGPGGDGGAIGASMLSATNVTATGNSAGTGGTGGAATGGHGGGAPDSGGGGGNGNGGPGDRGGRGGGVWLAGPGTSAILQATIVSNVAGAGGAGGAATRGDGGSGATPGAPGIAISGTPGSPGNAGAAGSASGPGTTLQNSIVASNSVPGCAGTVTDGGHDIALADPACPGSSVDPRLEPLADNGGPTETMAPAPDSPALDAIPATGAACPSTDQRGVTRPQGAACDIGAFETEVPAQMTTPPPSVGAATTQGGPPGPPLGALARLTHLSVSSHVFTAAPAGPSALSSAKHSRFGSIVSFTLGEPASVRFEVARPLPGRVTSGGRCVAPSPTKRRAHKCTRLVAVRGGFTRSAAVGANRFRFTGRIARHRLPPGSYELLAIPSVGTARGVPAAVGFRIIRG